MTVYSMKKMSRKFLIPLIILSGCLIHFNVFSQNTEEIIVFKNGTRITGTLMGSTHPDSVAVLTCEPVIRVFGRDQIVETKPELKKGNNKRAFSHEQGIVIGLDGGVLYGFDTDWDPMIGGALRLSIGYAFNKHMEAGLLTGVEGIGGPLAPFQAYYSYIVPFSESAFITTLNAGYALPLIQQDDDWHDTNNMGGVALGLEVGIIRPSGFFISTGYRFQRIRIDEKWEPWYYAENNSFILAETNENTRTTINLMQRFVFRLGFRFN